MFDSFPSVAIYEPLNVAGLHRRFGRMGEHDSSLVHFVRRYGFLGHGPLVMPRGDQDGVFRCEAVRVWRREIAAMKRLVAIWDLVKRKNAGKLSQWIRWDVLMTPESEPKSRKRVRWNDLADGGEMSTLALEGDWLQDIPPKWRWGDVIEPAYYYVCMKVNDRLQEHVNPYVLPLVRGDITLFPDCLLSAMYVQFALELSGKTRPAIICKGCSRYFNPVHGTQRYCESSSRKRRWWRDRPQPQERIAR